MENQEHAEDRKCNCAQCLTRERLHRNDFDTDFEDDDYNHHDEGGEG